MSRIVRTLTWQEFDLAVVHLAGLVDLSRPVIYGVPRGGLPLAVALSHATGIPLSMTPHWDMVCVDDIVDKGVTIARARMLFPDAQYLAWIARAGHDVRAAEEKRDDAWVLFPWERPEKAEEDERRYGLSRERAVPDDPG